VPWSLIEILGHPNLVITFSNKKCVVFSMLQYFTSVASADVVKYSVMVIRYLAPKIFVGGLIGPIKYISHSLNIWKVTCGPS
jgi:hypothetical protein